MANGPDGHNADGTSGDKGAVNGFDKAASGARSAGEGGDDDDTVLGGASLDDELRDHDTDHGEDAQRERNLALHRLAEVQTILNNATQSIPRHLRMNRQIGNNCDVVEGHLDYLQQLLCAARTSLTSNGGEMTDYHSFVTALDEKIASLEAGVGLRLYSKSGRRVPPDYVIRTQAKLQKAASLLKGGESTVVTGQMVATLAATSLKQWEDVGIPPEAVPFSEEDFYRNSGDLLLANPTVRVTGTKNDTGHFIEIPLPQDTTPSFTRANAASDLAQNLLLGNSSILEGGSSKSTLFNLVRNNPEAFLALLASVDNAHAIAMQWTHLPLETAEARNLRSSLEGFLPQLTRLQGTLQLLLEHVNQMKTSPSPDDTDRIDELLARVAHGFIHALQNTLSTFVLFERVQVDSVSLQAPALDGAAPTGTLEQAYDHLIAGYVAFFHALKGDFPEGLSVDEEKLPAYVRGKLNALSTEGEGSAEAAGDADAGTSDEAAKQAAADAAIVAAKANFDARTTPEQVTAGTRRRLAPWLVAGLGLAASGALAAYSVYANRPDAAEPTVAPVAAAAKAPDATEDAVAPSTEAAKTPEATDPVASTPEAAKTAAAPDATIAEVVPPIPTSNPATPDAATATEATKTAASAAPAPEASSTVVSTNTPVGAVVGTPSTEGLTVGLTAHSLPWEAVEIRYSNLGGVDLKSYPTRGAMAVTTDRVLADLPDVVEKGWSRWNMNSGGHFDRAADLLASWTQNPTTGTAWGYETTAEIMNGMQGSPDRNLGRVMDELEIRDRQEAVWLKKALASTRLTADEVATVRTTAMDNATPLADVPAQVTFQGPAPAAETAQFGGAMEWSGVAMPTVEWPDVDGVTVATAPQPASTEPAQIPGAQKPTFTSAEEAFFNSTPVPADYDTPTSDAPPAPPSKSVVARASAWFRRVFA